MATVRSASDTSRVDLGWRVKCLLEAADGDLRSATGKGKSGTNTEGCLARDSRREIEFDGDRAVDGLEDGHGEVSDRAGADGVCQRTPAGHALVAGVHAQLLISVTETRRLTVPVTNAKDRGVLSSCNVGVGSNGRRCSTTSGDAHALGSDLELTLIENLGVILEILVEPVNSTLEPRLDTSSSTADPTTRRVGSVARDRKVIEKGHVNIFGLGDTRAGERQGVGAVEALAEIFGLNVTRVHVKGESTKVTVVVAVDITEERTARALLVRARSVSDHASVNVLATALEAPDVVVDEALRRVELGAGLAIDVEDIRALDG
ncbi:hypothetical protein HG531_001692 [Fusarium graminearum]|nr:hypothetical protein HG531_001692 [Fusarium graminearum]